MGYPYGTQGVPPALLAPGLPRKAGVAAVGADPTGLPAKFMLVRTNQIIRVPDWATYARMGATGAGGVGFTGNSVSYAGGGGGGGFAGSNAVKVTPGQPISVSFTAAGTIIEGLGYRLVGGNGANANNTPAAAPGGVGSGGDVNFNGGNGGAAAAVQCAASGGSAASRGGPGTAGVPTSTSGQATAGVQGGPGADHIGGGSGSGCGYYYGTTAAGGAVGTSPTAATLGSGVITVGLPATNWNGADCGGGSGGYADSQFPASPITAGAGLAVIEFW